MLFNAMRLKAIKQNVGLDGEEGQELNWWGRRAQYLEDEEVKQNQQRTSRKKVNEIGRE